jgi:hypothetical protein
LALAIGKQDAEQIRLLISVTLPAVEEIEPPLALTDVKEGDDKETSVGMYKNVCM